MPIVVSETLGKGSRRHWRLLHFGPVVQAGKAE